MKDYYEILEVSPNASEEVIEKAYKVLAKKYHPDLQNENQKQVAEQRMKLINEAYEILSNSDKKREYDEQLEQYRIQQETKDNYEKNYNEKQYEYEQPSSQEQINEQIELEKRVQQEYYNQQQRAYRRYLRGLGFRVKEKWTWKRFLKLLEALAIFMIAILIIWFFPPTHKLLVETYESNNIVKAIVDIIINIFKGIVNGIGAFFKGIFGIK